jgi:hypothetical protein
MGSVQGDYYSGTCIESHLFVAALHLIDRYGEKPSAVYCHINNGNQGGGDKDEEMLVKGVGDSRSVLVGRRVAMLDETDKTAIHHGCVFKISRDQAGQMIYAVKFDKGRDFDAEEFSIQQIEGKWDDFELHPSRLCG